MRKVTYFLFFTSAILIGMIGGILLKRNNLVPAVEIGTTKIVHDKQFYLIDDSPFNRVGRKPIDKIILGTVALNLPIQEGMATVGTGVVVKTPKGVVLVTAEHVAMTAWPTPLQACSIKGGDCVNLGNRFVLETDDPLSVNIGSDWVVYSPKELPKDTVPVSIAKNEPAVGDNLWLIGMPYGRGPWVSRGNVAWKWDGDAGGMLAVTGFAAPGFSGGGVFDEKGNLTGITVAITVDPRGEPQVNQILVVPIGNIWTLGI